jgi:DNA polymerase-3 subunit alpha
MPEDSFVHLHLHTEYSTLDGAVRIAELMKKAKEFGMPAVAITDHGNMYGAVEFYQAGKKAGIKPIIGCEVYMAPGKLTDRNATSGRDAAYHFTLLAKDDTGYHNLVKLVSIAHLDGVYYKPRIDKETLAKYSKGLIGLSGCLKGEINMHIQAEQLAKARQSVAEFRDILGEENFFLEMHNHGIDAQRKCNLVLPTLAHEFGLGLVAANDVHFLERSQHEAHDVMICIGTGANLADEKRMHYVPELYFKSPAEMRALFSEHPEAITNTLRIAEMCNFEMEFGKPKYPAYASPAGFTSEQYLVKICNDGLLARYGARVDAEPALRQRLEYELSVLVKTGFTDYFLIVWDFIHWAKQQGIPVGPGRGSAAGAMVAYVMGITDIDPLQFGLLFERFLNPERVSPPDIDVDFCQNRRGEVIEYVRQKYGERAVSQIATFGTLGAKSVVRDVGRVMGLGYSEGDRIAKMIPNELNMTLKIAAEKNPELKKAVETEASTRQLWEYATTLEGLTRNVGVHAAGVVISDRDLSEYIPLTRGNDGSVVSQYAMGPLTDLGMLKMDFLGLKTLTIIRDAETLIRRAQPGFDIAKIPLDDAPTFALLNRAETVGLFQIDGGMASWCRQFDFKSIDDIIALNALYRPGPMEFIPDYVKRKKGLTKVKYAHPLLQKVCGDTFGIMIYQEQVMEAAKVMAGYTLGQADLLRRAMGKKDVEKMAKERQIFVSGCEITHDIDAVKADEVFDLLEKFAGYGFNKSHSAAYGWITYQTAYLKANHTVEFMAALLSNEINNTEKISTFVGECQRLGIKILPPDVNRSGLKFTPEDVGDSRHADLDDDEDEDEELYEGERENVDVYDDIPVTNIAPPAAHKYGIRFGLAAIKNVGEAAMESAIAEREIGGAFKSLEDFCRRLDSRKINKKVLESLVKCGAFDFTGEDRAAVFAEIDEVLAAAASSHRDRASGQHSLFDSLAVEESAPQKYGSAKSVPPWPQAEKLGYEKELLGFYVTGHPLDEYRSLLEGGKFKAINSLAAQEEKTVLQVAGALENVDKKFTKKDGKPFAIIVLEDLTGSIEIMIWGDVFAKCSQHLEKGRVVAITARLEKRDESVRLVASEVKPLKAPPPGASEPPLVLYFEHERTTFDDLDGLKKLLQQFSGTRAVQFEFSRADGKRQRIQLGRQYRINLLPELREKLSAWTR